MFGSLYFVIAFLGDEVLVFDCSKFNRSGGALKSSVNSFRDTKLLNLIQIGNHFSIIL